MVNFYDIVLQDPVKILFTIVFILVLIGLCFLLFISIIKSAKKSKIKNTETINDGLVSKERLNEAINTFIKRFTGTKKNSLKGSCSLVLTICLNCVE